jgi:hypothetical protein
MTTANLHLVTAGYAARELANQITHTLKTTLCRRKTITIADCAEDLGLTLEEMEPFEFLAFVNAFDVSAEECGWRPVARFTELHVRKRRGA